MVDKGLWGICGVLLIGRDDVVTRRRKEVMVRSMSRGKFVVG